jgi:hypothetical protein
MNESQLEKVRHELYELKMCHMKLQNAILHAHRNIEAVGSILKNCGIDEKVIQDMSSILSNECEVIEMELGEMGIRRFGVYGNIMTDAPGWFQTNAPFMVLEPAWVYDKNGECELLMFGVGIHANSQKGVNL